MTPSFIIGGLLAASSPVGDFGGLPRAQPIIDRTTLRSASVADALRRAEARHAATCRDVVIGRPEMFLLWTLQWASAECPFVGDPRRGVKVTFRFVQKLDGTVELRRTRVRTIGLKP